jgi:uncharacterized protein (TIGR02611 family)
MHSLVPTSARRVPFLRSLKSVRGSRAAKSIAIKVAGWLLVAAGIAALVLPGPGLLALFAGMALLATQYDWAERRLEPVKKAALRTAAESVQSAPRILLSVVLAVALLTTGVVWGLRPEAPGWWPLADRWWLPGGWATGGTLIASAVAAGAMLVYSWLNYRDVRD